MTAMTTLDKVREMILKLKKPGISASDLKPEAALIRDLKLDSLDFPELIVLAEDAFSIKIPMTDASKLVTIAAAVEYFDKRRAARA